MKTRIETRPPKQESIYDLNLSPEEKQEIRKHNLETIQSSWKEISEEELKADESYFAGQIDLVCNEKLPNKKGNYSLNLDINELPDGSGEKVVANLAIKSLTTKAGRLSLETISSLDIKAHFDQKGKLILNIESRTEAGFEGNGLYHGLANIMDSLIKKLLIIYSDQIKGKMVYVVRTDLARPVTNNSGIKREGLTTSTAKADGFTDDPSVIGEDSLPEKTFVKVYQTGNEVVQTAEETNGVIEETAIQTGGEVITEETSDEVKDLSKKIQSKTAFIFNPKPQETSQDI
jgi:hypothetical protein